ncbi:hypothetical protein [uncultured Clostridium sp.]|jgi:DNA-binding beta-propeller fold protein YncE|uniref:hypothetical protein n=1 Tax=uncultured Clostridium sp. TaxID=59620 RepID=UPI00261AA348|nr:hypothetical protein [uncultured Clostridium sp.]
MTVHIKINEFDEKDLKNAYDLVMKKENTDAARGIQFKKKIKEDDKFDALVVVDQVGYHYYVVDRGNGLEVFDYDLENEKVLDIAYISKETKHGRNLVADAIKGFHKMYFDAIK